METSSLLRAYSPALEARQNVLKIAAGEVVEQYGVTASDAFVAPGTLTFGEFVRRPESLLCYGAAEVSDSTRLLLEFRRAFPAEATRKDLANYVRAHHKGKPRGFRYWDRLAGSIWKTYQGIVRGKERTGKAHAGEVTRLFNAEVRAGREATRSALRRVPKTESEKRFVEAARLRIKAESRLRRANKKAAKAERLLQDSAKLKAQAEQLLAAAQKLGGG